MNAPARITLPGWPRLMRAELAAAYLQIGETKLRERGPRPKRVDGCVVWDRHDLDRWVDALGGQPLDEEQREAEAGDILARVKGRLGTS